MGLPLSQQFHDQAAEEMTQQGTKVDICYTCHEVSR
jgi:hypothetical protein